MSSPTNPPASSKVHAKLLHGKPVRFNKNDPDEARTIPAQWIADAVIKGAEINVQHAIISGLLNLQYAIIEKEFALVACDILEVANFSYSTFKQNLLLTGSTFANGANFQAATMQYDAFLNGAKFLAGVAIFRDLHAQGILYAQGTHFGKDVEANFNRARIDKSAFFHGTSFGGEANFGAIQVGSIADFRSAVFRENASFNRAKIAGSVFFRARPESKKPAATFEGKADFVGCKVGSNAEFEGVAFRKNVTFNSATITGSAFFCDRPEKNISAATFEGEANFISCKIGGSAAFHAAEFKGVTRFGNAEIGGTAIFHDAKFLAGSKPAFDGTQFRQGAFFEGARFEDAVNFRTAQFDVEARFHGVTFAKEANFDASRFTGLANFSKSPDKVLPGAVFNEASFEHTHFEHDVRFDETVFRGETTFREASFQVVYFSPNGQAQGQSQFQGSVDLRGCTYERIQTDWRSLLRWPDGTPRLEPYERQPYTQLENVFRAVGQDRQADDVYLERRRLERTRLSFRRDFFHWWGDWVYKWVFNYGVRPWRLVLVPPLLLLLLGTFIFSRPGAARARSVTQSSEQTFTRTRINEPAQLIETPALSSEDAFRLSIRLFLPIGVPLATRWEASDNQFALFRFSDFAAALQLAAWVLGALYAAAFKGWLRSSAP